MSGMNMATVKLSAFYVLSATGIATADTFSPGLLFAWAIGIGAAGGFAVTLDLRGDKYDTAWDQVRALIDVVFKAGCVSGILYLLLSSYASVGSSMTLGLCGLGGITSYSFLDSVQRFTPNFLEAARKKLYSVLGLEDTSTTDKKKKDDASDVDKKDDASDVDK